MIKIIAIGKVKEQYLRDGINDYMMRIKKYTKIELIELMDSDIKTEKKLILKHISDKDYLIILDINGVNLSSIELSTKINTLYIDGYSNITFVIGSSDGLDQEIKERADFSWSFSHLTFPHQLFRLMLMEQLYRSFKILNNETYHK